MFMSVSESEKLKAHLADKVNLFLCGSWMCKVIMGIMEHAAVWVSTRPAYLLCYNPQTGGLAGRTKN